MYTRIKNVHGRKYKYLVTGKKIGSKVKQKVLKYLGPVDPIYKINKPRKTNASIYVRDLLRKEIKSLRTAIRSSNSFTKDRARILLLSSKNFFAKQIAKKISCDSRKVRIAIKDFNKKGLKALKRGKAKGSEPKFTESIKKIILLHYSKNPRKYGYHFTTWTLPRFRKHLIDYNVIESISIETLRQILIKAGAKLKRSKRWQYSPDKDFYKKNAK